MARPLRNACQPCHGRFAFSSVGRMTATASASKFIGCPCSLEKMNPCSGLPHLARCSSRRIFSFSFTFFTTASTTVGTRSFFYGVPISPNDLIRCFLFTNCAPQSAIRDSLRDANHTGLFLFCWQLRVCRYSPPRFSVRRGSDEPTTARKSQQAQDCISPAMYWPSTGLSTITGNVITARYGHTATFASKRKTFLR